MTRTAHSVLAVDLHGKPDFHSRCPEHGKKSTVHRGQQLSLDGKRFDAWRCKEAGGHIFTSTPMPGMPTPEELPTRVAQGTPVRGSRSRCP